MIHEHLGAEHVELFLHGVVFTFAHASKFGKACVAQPIAGRRKGGEGVLGLTNGDDIAHDAQEGFDGAKRTDLATLHIGVNGQTAVAGHVGRAV